jgi:hypothetical protein
MVFFCYQCHKTMIFYDTKLLLFAALLNLLLAQLVNYFNPKKVPT